MATDKTVERLTRWTQRGTPGTIPVPAATVVVIRDAPSGGLETLMLRRNSKLAFGGMWVFPGGRVDPADREGIDPDDELGAASRAAVREAVEEAGLVLRADDLVPISHWTPPAVTPKRFLTWFFLAPAPTGPVSIDEGEIHAHEWMRPSAAIQRRDANEIELAPPTFVTLHRLLRHSDVASALAELRAAPNESFETRVAMHGGAPVALWQGDAGWSESRADAIGARHRLVMKRSPWRYERSD